MKIEGVEKSYFIDLVLASDARSKKGKIEARKRLEKYDFDKKPEESQIREDMNESMLNQVSYPAKEVSNLESSVVN